MGSGNQPRTHVAQIIAEQSRQEYGLLDETGHRFGTTDSFKVEELPFDAPT